MDAYEDEALKDLVEADEADNVSGRVTVDYDGELERALVSATGKWGRDAIAEADRRREAGDRRANRIQTWCFDQDKVWINMLGETIPVESMDERYLISMAAFLMRSAPRFAQTWVSDHLIACNPESDFASARPNYERVYQAHREPHKFMAETLLYQTLWYNVFKRRGRIGNGGEVGVED